VFHTCITSHFLLNRFEVLFASTTNYCYTHTLNHPLGNPTHILWLLPLRKYTSGIPFLASRPTSIFAIFATFSIANNLSRRSRALRLRWKSLIDLDKFLGNCLTIRCKSYSLNYDQGHTDHCKCRNFLIQL